MLGVAADEYFCSTLARMASGFKMSPEVAGITILALGNGAPDVGTSLAAVASGNFGTSLGELLGAGVFVTTIVLAVVTLASSTEVRVDSFYFIRDTVFFVFAVFAIGGVLFDKKVALYESSLLLLYYVGYVLFVTIYHYCCHTCANNKSRFLTVTVQDEASLLVGTKDSKDIEERPKKSYFSWVGWREEWSYRRSMSKVTFCCTFPFQVWMFITCFDSTRWNRVTAVLVPIFSPQIILLSIHKIDVTIGSAKFPVAAVLLILGFVVSVVIFFTSTTEDPPKYQPVLTFWTFVISVFWIWLISAELVYELQSMGIILNVSNVIIGATVLTWGNSVGDIVANPIMARKGFPKMAVSACYGGPLFNLLFGLGLALTYECIRDFPKPFEVELDHWSQIYWSISLLAGSLIASLLAISFIWHFKIPRKWGLVLVVIYLLFSGFLLLIEFGVMWQ